MKEEEIRLALNAHREVPEDGDVHADSGPRQLHGWSHRAVTPLRFRSKSRELKMKRRLRGHRSALRTRGRGSAR
jgi:hypothetical protein